MVKLNNRLVIPIYVIAFFSLISSFRSCSTAKESVRLRKEIDSLRIEISNHPTHEQLKRELQIEGLKSEKRMIQSTDRKMLDVNRQTEIDNEIRKLENK